jgi:predicted ester cyclase
MLDPRTVVRRYLAEALVTGDPRAIDELIANGPVRERVLAFRSAFPDLAIQVEQLVAEGELVAVRATGRATHAGAFQGIPATGRAWTATCTAIYRVVSGAIVEAWVQWDVLAILEQIGGVRRVEAATA